MAVLYSFFRYFSVRLGSILVALSSMIQSLAFTGLLIFWLQDKKEAHDDTSKSDFEYFEDILNILQIGSPGLFLKVGVVFLLFHISTCVLLIYAAIKCNIPLIWPFLVVEFLRLFLLFSFHIAAMIFIQRSSIDLGLLVGLCLLGSFILLGLYYMWFCVYSLCQCIQELEHQSPAAAAVHRQMKMPSQNIQTDRFFVVSDFKHNKSSFNHLLGPQTVHRHSYLNQNYHYGNLAWPTK